MKTLIKISVILIVVSFSEAKIPEYFKTCKLTDPNLNECVKNSAQNGLKPFTKEFNKTVSFDPMIIPLIELPDANNGPVQMSQRYTDTILHGMGNSKIETLSIDPETLNMNFSMMIPCHMHGNYDIFGNILILPIKGNGEYKITMEGVLEFKLKNSIVEKGGKKYLHIDDMDIHLVSYKTMVFDFENLFGNKQLSDNMNKVINDNLADLMPFFAKQFRIPFRKIFCDLGNQMLSMWPLDELFPEDKERFL